VWEGKVKRVPVTKKAPFGEKMVEVKLRFWTNNISSEPNKIRRRHAWTSGVVRMERNDSHGIVPNRPKHFHSLLDVGAVIERVLIENGIVLHTSGKMSKYLKT
jgi:hypothetical protein